MVKILSEIFKIKKQNKPTTTTNAQPNNNKETQAQEIFLKCWICLDKISPEAFNTHLIECYEKNKTEEGLNVLHDELSFVKLVKSLNSQEQYLSAVEILKKIVNNILMHPEEAKYQRLRYTSGIITDNIISLKFGIKLLEYLDFIRNADEDVFIFKADNLKLLNKKLSDIINAQSLNKELYSRNQIIIKPHLNNAAFRQAHQINSELGDTDFELTTEEMSRHFNEVKKRNELAQTLMTSAQRQKLDQPNKTPIPLTTNLKFVFPDQTILQANFLLNETLGDVFTYLRSLVNYPQHHFKLYSTTNRRTYKEKDITSAMLQLQQEAFYPNSIFHFNWEDNSKQSHIKLEK